MGHSKTWLLVTDHKFWALGDCFFVPTSEKDDVGDLKEKVKKKRQHDLTHIDVPMLTVKKT